MFLQGFDVSCIEAEKGKLCFLHRVSDICHVSYKLKSTSVANKSCAPNVEDDKPDW